MSGGFEIIPAIDLLGGEAVRLSQGRYDEATVYESDPARVAAEFAAHGIARLHMVDLDGARAGAPVNGKSIRAVVEAVGDVPVQLGGGIRTLAAVEEALAHGVQRVILGTVALRDPQLVHDAAARYPGCIVVGIDAREGRVAVEGWLKGITSPDNIKGHGKAEYISILPTWARAKASKLTNSMFRTRIMLPTGYNIRR